MLSPQSQLVLRNIDRLNSHLAGGNLLIINPPGDALARDLATQEGIHPRCFTQDLADARALEAMGLDVDFGAVPADAALDSAVLVFHPKERALTDFLLFLARSRLKAGGSLWLVGENKGGIRATEKRLKDAGISIDKIDSARHCQLLRITPKSTGAPFALEDWLEVVEIEIGADTLAVASLPGVFSAGRLDEGSAMLLETLSAPLKGRVLDMGCGAGVIGAVLKKRNADITLEMVDSDAMAVLTTEWTLKENALQAHAYASDGFSAVKGTFDWIISNPPFHAGIATDYRFAEKFIADAKFFLKPGGRLRLVANAHLTYAPSIQAAFGNCRIVAENAKFRIFEAIRR